MHNTTFFQIQFDIVSFIVSGGCEWIAKNLENSDCTIDKSGWKYVKWYFRGCECILFNQYLILEWSKCNFVNSSIRSPYFIFWYWIVSFTMVNRFEFNHKIVPRLVFIQYWAIYASADCSMECIYSKHS